MIFEDKECSRTPGRSIARPGAQGKESENCARTCVRNDDDVGAAEQLIDSLGGCRPRLTSPPGALLPFLLLQLHFLTQSDALAVTGERSTRFQRAPIGPAAGSHSRFAFAPVTPSETRVFRDDFNPEFPRAGKCPGVPDSARRVALLHNKHRINHSGRVLDGASVRGQLPTGGRYHSETRRTSARR